jgi:hypothetical protein
MNKYSAARLFALFSVVFLVSAAAPPKASALCHYWSYEGCVWHCDTAYNLGQIGIVEWVDCISLCSDCEELPEKDNCPLLLDLGEPGIALTSAANGLAFDIDGDGVADRISWTAASAADAFIALDRNHNGSIDSGAELFGNATEQPGSSIPNGFLALAVFDDAAHGGNGDGVISALDGVWGSLLLWTDRSHDGISQASELSPIASTGIAAIELQYKESGRRDRYGNIFRYRSSAVTSQGKKSDVIDVFFLQPRQ